MLLQAPGSRLAPMAVTYHARPREWEVLQPYSYWDAEAELRITVTRGFRCDLASVPRPVWWLIAPFELSIVAPVFHDALHRHGGVSGLYLDIQGPNPRYVRSSSDRLFRTQMRQEEVDRWRREAAYRAVRLFGRGSWRGE